MMAHFLMPAIAGAARRRATTGASPYVFADDFEAYADAAEATASNNWVSTGTPTFGYSTSPLQGSRSLMINGLPTATSKSFAAGDDPWIYFRFRVNDTAFGQTIITLLGSDGSTVAVLSLLAGGKLSAKIGVGTPRTPRPEPSLATRIIQSGCLTPPPRGNATCILPLARPDRTSPAYPTSALRVRRLR